MSLSLIDLSSNLTITSDTDTLTVNPTNVNINSLNTNGIHNVTFTATDVAGNKHTKDVALIFTKPVISSDASYVVSGESVDVLLPLNEIVDATSYITHDSANIAINASSSHVSNNVNFNTDACGNFQMVYDISDAHFDISTNKTITFDVRETQDLTSNSNITVDGSNGKYVFDNIPYDASNLIAVTTGSYNLDISGGHPFQIVNIDSNSFISMIGTVDASGYYTGDASLNITGNFGVASFKCKEHGPMGGTNKLIYKSS